jgi:hypothetical protein
MLLHRRAIVPDQTYLLGGHKEKAQDDTALPDLKNVQGDVYFMFPKARLVMSHVLTDDLRFTQRWQRFMFFKITDVTQFQKDLDTYTPKITSSSRTAEDLNKIHHKGGASLDIVSSGIAFTKAGLKMMGIKDSLEDPHFDQGSLFNEKKKLGDSGQYDKVFNGDGENHGVILLTAGSKLDFLWSCPVAPTDMSFAYRARHMQDKDD